MNQQQDSQQFGNRDCCSDIKLWWQKAPFINKYFLIICSCMFMLDTVLGNIIIAWLINAPVITVYKLQFWRFATTLLVHNNIIDLLLSFLLLYSLGTQIERTIGSVHFFLELIGKNLLIQIMFSTIIILLSLTSSMFNNFYSNGLFPTFIMLQTLQCMATPEEDRQFLCFPFTIKSKFYIWVLFLFFCVLNGQILWDMLCAILLALIEVRYFQHDLFKFSVTTIIKLENSFLFRKFLNHPNFIHKQNSNLPTTAINYNNVNSESQNSSGNQQIMQGRPVQIGSSLDQSNQNDFVVNPSQKNQKENNSDALNQMKLAAMLREQYEEKQKQQNQPPEDQTNQQQSVIDMQSSDDQLQQAAKQNAQSQSKDPKYTKLNEEQGQQLI